IQWRVGFARRLSEITGTLPTLGFGVSAAFRFAVPVPTTTAFWFSVTALGLAAGPGAMQFLCAIGGLTRVSGIGLRSRIVRKLTSGGLRALRAGFSSRHIASVAPTRSLFHTLSRLERGVPFSPNVPLAWLTEPRWCAIRF